MLYLKLTLSRAGIDKNLHFLQNFCHFFENRTHYNIHDHCVFMIRVYDDIANSNRWFNDIEKLFFLNDSIYTRLELLETELSGMNKEHTFSLLLDLGA